MRRSNKKVSQIIFGRVFEADDAPFLGPTRGKTTEKQAENADTQR